MMTQPELVAWMEFYKLEPFDDLHRYKRPAAMIAGFLSGGDPNPPLSWLLKEYVPDYTDADLRTIQGLGLKRPPPSRS